MLTVQGATLLTKSKHRRSRPRHTAGQKRGSSNGINNAMVGITDYKYLKMSEPAGISFLCAQTVAIHFPSIKHGCRIIIPNGIARLDSIET